jgi:LacI family transcriptional regulator, repressor for deo operon, udp, cdd, tsx, nupC, and nupG
VTPVPVTLRDVALRAGVSTRTVSNVVNDFHHVSPAMRAKVQVALDELNYTPNLLARSLRQGRTGIITLLVPDIAVTYFGELAHEVVDQASELGFTVMIDETTGEPQRERALLDVAVQSSWVDGVLLSSMGLDGRDLSGLGSDKPVVLLGERTAKTALDHVGIDDVRAARDAVRHLIESGRRRVAAMGGSATGSDATSRLRLRGYRNALRSAGLLAGERYVRTPDYKRASAAAAVRTVFGQPDPPDALFCFSDDLAAGALRALFELDVQVPDEVSVVGFDDVEESTFATPALTSIRPDKGAIATVALTMLIERIRGSVAPPRDVRVGHQLIVRESSSGFGQLTARTAAN